MIGKSICKALRELRKKIAGENDIPFSTEECGFEGDCPGTCPKCDSELEYLERELDKRRSSGKRITIFPKELIYEIFKADGPGPETTAGVPAPRDSLTEKLRRSSCPTRTPGRPAPPYRDIKRFTGPESFDPGNDDDDGLLGMIGDDSDEDQ